MWFVEERSKKRRKKEAAPKTYAGVVLEWVKKEERKKKEREKKEKMKVWGTWEKKFFFLVLHIAAFFKNAAIGYPLKKFIRLDL